MQAQGKKNSPSHIFLVTFLFFSFYLQCGHPHHCTYLAPQSKSNKSCLKLSNTNINSWAGMWVQALLIFIFFNLFCMQPSAPCAYHLVPHPKSNNAPSYDPLPT
jgi:hypothetical protein